MTARKTSPKRIVRQRPLLQWGAAVVGGVMTAAVVAMVIWEALLPEAPPDLTARIVQRDTRSGGAVVEVEVSNHGRETATNVEIEGLSDGASATTTIDYVPGQGQGRAYLRFDGDPGAVRVSVKGWVEP
jgi:uncharacterized protein (TIGR02588 family)